MSDFSIRNGIANICGWMFETALNPLANISSTISAVINSANGHYGQDILAGNAIAQLSSNIHTTVLELGQGLESTGYALCFLFFLISLVELAMSERMTMEYFIKYFSKLVIGVAAVFYWQDIYRCCRGFGNLLASFITDNQEAPPPLQLQEAFRNYVNNSGASTWLPLVLGSFLIAAPLIIASFAIVGVVYVIIFTWLLELGIRACFLPIACSLLSDDGWRGAGGRYIRKLLGVACQGAVMVTVSTLTSTGLHSIVRLAVNEASSKTSFDGDWDFLADLAQSIVVVIAVCIASVSIMFKTSAIVSDVFGG